jgi:hypothetical protein
VLSDLWFAARSDDLHWITTAAIAPMITEALRIRYT